MLEQVAKINEEHNEFLLAVLSKDANNSIEEFYDVMQSMLGLLHQIGLTANYVESQYDLHLKKIENRPRKFLNFNDYCTGFGSCSECPLKTVDFETDDSCEVVYEAAVKNNGKFIIEV